jgi:hypothetical protein
VNFQHVNGPDGQSHKQHSVWRISASIVPPHVAKEYAERKHYDKEQAGEVNVYTEAEHIMLDGLERALVKSDE